MSPEPISGEPKRTPPRGQEAPLGKHPMTPVFLGPHGLRVGWRLVIAVSLWLLITGILPMFLIWIPSVRGLLTQLPGPIIITPGLLLFADGVMASASLLTALIMTRIENGSFFDYGMPGWAAFGKRFWQGGGYGFAMISLLIGVIAALRGFSVSGIDLHVLPALRYASLYFVGFITVAIFEEFSFRGYLQSTLQSVTGFWPAAVIWAAGFVAIHLNNPGETKFGLLMVGCFGLLAAFTLRRTGNIWFAVGMHVTWDWGETFFYSVRDSGVPAVGHLLKSDFHGPTWLTGGSAGPEGSLVSLGVLVLSAVVFHFLFPANTQSS